MSSSTKVQHIMEMMIRLLYLRGFVFVFMNYIFVMTLCYPQQYLSWWHVRKIFTSHFTAKRQIDMMEVLYIVGQISIPKVLMQPWYTTLPCGLSLNTWLIRLPPSQGQFMNKFTNAYNKSTDLNIHHSKKTIWINIAILESSHNSQ